MQLALWLSKQGQAKLSALPTMTATVKHTMATKAGKFYSLKDHWYCQKQKMEQTVASEDESDAIQCFDHINSNIFTLKHNFKV